MCATEMDGGSVMIHPNQGPPRLSVLSADNAPLVRNRLADHVFSFHCGEVVRVVCITPLPAPIPHMFLGFLWAGLPSGCLRVAWVAMDGSSLFSVEWKSGSPKGVRK